MEEKDKLNVILIWFGVLVFLGSLVIVMELRYKKDDKIIFNGVELSESDYDSIQEVFDDNYLAIKVCNIKRGNCIAFFDLEDINNYS